MKPFKITIKPDSADSHIVWFHFTVDAPHPGRGVNPIRFRVDVKERQADSRLMQLARRLQRLVPNGLVSLYWKDRYAISLKRGVGFEWEPLLNGMKQAIVELYEINADDVKVVGKTAFLIAAGELDENARRHIPVDAGVDVTG